MKPKKVFILTNLAPPTSRVANNLTEPELYEACNVAPLTKVGFVFVNENPPKLVPIPLVITDGTETVKFPVPSLLCAFVTLNAVTLA
jgi:hypothetical protein